MLSNCSMPDSKNKPGDQANIKGNGGEEYGLIKWYDKPWLGILRYNGDSKEKVRVAISNCAIAAAKNNHIGYSQSARGSYLTQLKKVKWDPSAIKTNCGADCSSSTATNVIAAGHLCSVSKLSKSSIDVTSSTIVIEYKKLGFKYYTEKKYRNGEKNLVPGDILVGSGHVAIYVGDGKGTTVASSAKAKAVDSIPKDFKQNRTDKTTSGNGATLRKNGCGPTSVADVIGACSKLNQGGKLDNITVFKYYVKAGLITGGGSGNKGINQALKHFGIDSKHITKYRGDSDTWVPHGDYLPKKQMDALLKNLKVFHVWAICLTDEYGGHFMVAYTANDKVVYMRDPWGPGKKTLSISEFRNTVRSAWAIDVATYEPNGISGAKGSGSGSFVDDGQNINLQDAIAQLYSSDNYKWVSDNKPATEETFADRVKKSTIEQVKAIIEQSKGSKEIISDSLFTGIINTIASIAKREVLSLTTTERKLVKGNLSSYPNLVEAPFIEVNMNGITIGGYNHQEDKYPNNLVSLDVEKINGRINNYTINLVHQVRAGEDPNFIDSLLSRTGVRNKVKIKYGDSAYGAFFKEEEAYIIDVTYSEDVTSSRINYTIKAVSSVGSIQQAYFNFPGLQSKPSTEIINMLYKDKNTSSQLLSVLGGMQNKAYILGSGYIPTDDASIWIPGGDNMSLVERLQQLVTYMYDPIDPSASYFLSFEDNGQNNAIFKINKVQKSTLAADRIKNCYYLDVGYPGESFVTAFNLNNEIYWPMYFKYAGKFSEYKYSIDYTGQLISKKVNPLTISDRYGTIDVERMNWWNFVTSYPISATVTIKGLMKPTMLIENVYVYAQFYGQEDMATGLYSIVGQQDNISGSGCTTTLQLLRIQN